MRKPHALSVKALMLGTSSLLFLLCIGYLHGAPRVIMMLRDKSDKIKTDVVIFVPTPMQWGERRKYVYNQFVKEGWKHEQAILIFVFGSRDGEDLTQSINTSSIERYPLAVNLVTDCRDMDRGQEYNNPSDTSATTCKVYKALKHIGNAYEARYVWRGADDSYVNLRYFFAHVMHTIPTERLFMGRLRRADTIQDDLLLEKQPRLRELYGIYQFGQYMHGMGFLFSFDVVQFIAAFTITPHLTWCEDVMVGMWLNPFQITFMDRTDFLCLNNFPNTLQPDRDYLVVHYMTPKLWDSIGMDGRFYEIT
jgi:hypothetical protein